MTTAPDGHPLSYVVFANAKSGTTWVQRMLNDLPRVACGESRAFGLHFDPSWKLAPQQPIEQFVEFLSRHVLDPVAERDRGRAKQDLMFSVAEAVHRTVRDASGKPIYGEKITPYPGTSQHVVDRLHAYNPNTRFIHLVRDGRDVAVSAWVHATWAKAARHDDEAIRWRVRMVEEGRIDDEALEGILSRWVETVEAARSARVLFEHYHEVRYEDLLADPTGVMTQLLRFMGSNTDAEDIAACVRANTFEKLSGGRTPGQEDRANFFRKGEAGDWRNWLTPEQERAAESIAGRLLLEPVA